jgi:hypothetical protein
MMQGMIGFQMGTVMACALLLPIAHGARAQPMTASRVGATQAGATIMNVAANGAPGGGASGNAETQASSSASASAGVSNGTGDGGGSCNAESSAQAEARLGNQVIRKSARKEATQSGQGCSAMAQSSASVHSDP